ncbi:hypothetical protein [Methanococcus voltae]|uniref:hypothetical protein n=1 Tax=Methanococcus voltae TaxID=2188 RepID=UPI001AE30B63|nr:hypothetical protein [Methanococcus voltae]MBP2173261.1 hypothetical protein [Methanococcus voltae]
MKKSNFKKVFSVVLILFTIISVMPFEFDSNNSSSEIFFGNNSSIINNTTDTIKKANNSLNDTNNTDSDNIGDIGVLDSKIVNIRIK